MRKSPFNTDLHATIMCTGILYRHVPDKFAGTPLLVQKFNYWYSMPVQGETDYNILILLIIIYIFAGTGKITGTACWYSATWRIHCLSRYSLRKCTSTPEIRLNRQKQTFSVEKFGNFPVLTEQIDKFGKKAKKGRPSFHFLSNGNALNFMGILLNR
jgi:hypothetical protein